MLKPTSPFSATLAAAAIIILVFAASRVNAQSPRLLLFSPIGGESLVVDSTWVIRWNAMNISDSLHIEYSVDSAATWKPIDIVAAREGNDSLAWRVPNDTTSYGFVRIRTADSNVRSRSLSRFVIVSRPPQYVRIAYPNGGELYARDSVVEVFWYYQNINESWIVEYSLDSGATWTLIGVRPPGLFADSLDWTVPGDTTRRGLIRVRTASDAHRDVSDRVFSIQTTVRPMITVVYPNGGEVFQRDSMVRVRWIARDVIGTVSVQYSSDDGASWRPIGTVRPARIGADSTTWRVPTDSSTTARVRVRTSTAGDTSDNYFTILPPPPPPPPPARGIVLLTMNGGVYHADSVVLVKWVANSVAGDIVVEYSVDSMRTWRIVGIAPPTGGADSMRWTIPDQPTTRGFVRVRSADGGIDTVSSTPFTIIGRPAGARDEIAIDRVAIEGIYPTPARDHAVIRWSSRASGHATMRIIDARGMEVGALELGFTGAGEHSTRIDLAPLGAGMYRCQLRIAGLSVSRSLIVME